MLLRAGGEAGASCERVEPPHPSPPSAMISAEGPCRAALRGGEGGLELRPGEGLHFSLIWNPESSRLDGMNNVQAAEVCLQSRDLTADLDFYTECSDSGWTRSSRPTIPVWPRCPGTACGCAWSERSQEPPAGGAAADVPRPRRVADGRRDAHGSQRRAHPSGRRRAVRWRRRRPRMPSSCAA